MTIARDRGLDYVLHVMNSLAGTSSRSLPAFFCRRPDQNG
jgi:hypothetical protein